MAIPKLKSITFKDVRRAAAVVRHIADKSPSIEEFDYLAALLCRYAELADLYRELTEDERVAFELADAMPRGVD